METLHQSICQVVEISSGRFGVFAKTIDDAQTVELAVDEVLPTASSIKLHVLYALLEGVDREIFSLDERLELKQAMKKPVSGILFHLTPGLKPTLKGLATLMLIISDNSALAILVDCLGLDTINRSIESLGLNNTRMGDWRNFETGYSDSMLFGQGTPREFAGFLIRLRREELLNKNTRDLFWNILRIQKYIEPRRKLLPASPWAREFNLAEPVWIASKNGALDDCCCESGYVQVNHGGWVISIMFSDLPDSEVARHETMISEISRPIYNAWEPYYSGEKI